MPEPFLSPPLGETGLSAQPDLLTQLAQWLKQRAGIPQQADPEHPTLGIVEFPLASGRERAAEIGTKNIARMVMKLAQLRGSGQGGAQMAGGLQGVPSPLGRALAGYDRTLGGLHALPLYSAAEQGALNEAMALPGGDKELRALTDLLTSFRFSSLR